MEKIYNLCEVYNGRILRIPDYQRGYAWTAKKEVKEFWEDIMNLTAGRKHYTGMISLKRLDKNKLVDWKEEKWALDSYDPFHVVDGQQRLTTISILLTCIVNKIRSLKKNAGKKDTEIVFAKKTLDKIIEEFICETNAEFESEKIYKFGYESDNPSYKYLKQEIFGENLNEELSRSFYTLNLKNAKIYFENKINELSTDENEIENILKEIFQKVTHDLMFNLQDLDDAFDVFIAFETMNNRGLELSILEKLKNRLMYLTKLYPTSELSDDQNILLRTKINDAWKEVYKQLGRNEKHCLDDNEYLRNHWYMYFKYSRSKTSYDKFLLSEKFTQKNVLSVDPKIHLKNSEIVNYINDLSNTAKYWYYSFNPYDWSDSKPLDNEEKKWIDKLNRLEMAYFRPIVVAALMNPNASSEERLALFKAIERFVFISFRSCEYRTQHQQSHYLGKLRELKNGDISVQEITADLEDATSKSIEQIDSFVNRINKYFDSKDGFYSWEGLKYFLYEYESDLVEKNGSLKIDADDFFRKNEEDSYSVEHIFPQTSEKVWYWANNFRFFDDNEKRILCNSLGNLLPLSKALNSKLQNYSYPDKRNGTKNKDRKGYINGSHSETELANKYSDWNHNNIKERGLKLLEFYEKRWNVKFNNDQKEKLLHTGFLKTKNYKIPDIPFFKDDINYISKTSFKYSKKSFWARLTNKAQSLLTSNNEFSDITNGFVIWMQKQYNGKCNFLFRIEQNDKKLLLQLGSYTKGFFNKLAESKDAIEKDSRISFNWDRAKTTHFLTITSVDFDLADYNSWNNAIDEICKKTNEYVLIFEKHLINLSSENITRQKKPRISEEDFLKDKSSNEKLLSIYKELKARLDTIYTDSNVYFKDDYCAYKKKIAFVKIMIRKNDIFLLVRYSNVDIKGGKRVPDTNGWSLDYSYSLYSTNAINDALKIIKASYNETNK